MGLAIVVGILADLAENDPDGVEYFRKTFDHVNQLLSVNGIPKHDEPTELPALNNRCSLGSYPYSFIHYLRRAYAHRINDPFWVATPLSKEDDPVDDPIVKRSTDEMRSHLLCHSDAEGFYLPIDFDEILFDNHRLIPGGMIGSSFRLHDELVLVAPALEIRLEDKQLSDAAAERINSQLEKQEGLWLEQIVWLSLFEASRLSIQYKTAICFS